MIQMTVKWTTSPSHATIGIRFGPGMRSVSKASAYKFVFDPWVPATDVTRGFSDFRPGPAIRGSDLAAAIHNPP